LAKDITADPDRYKLVGNVACPTCSDVFQLWAPLLETKEAELETEETEVEAHKKWLIEHLATKCPNHADQLRTPDRPQ
jgi:hypothetical protein